MTERESSSSLFAEFPPISLEEWEEQIKKDLNGKNYRNKLVWEPIGEFPIYPFYRREDIESLDHLDTKPGQYPYLRGTDPSGNTWKIRESVRGGVVQEANSMAQKAVERGAEALSFHIKPQPTEGMLGGDLEGTSVQSQQDFTNLLKGLELPELLLHFDTGISTPAYLSMLSNLARTADQNPEDWKAAFSYDPFTYTATYGKWPSKKSTFVNNACQMVNYCQVHLSGVRPLCIKMAPYHYAGASNVQQLGIAMAVGQEYLAHLTDEGADSTDIAQHLFFSVPIGTGYFLEIAKLRALRMLWSRILEAYLPDTSSIPPAVIHASTSSWSHSSYDAHTNIVRNTSQAMSAIIGGCESLAVVPHDTTYQEPTEFSRRIARNIQHLLRDESHFDQVADPAGGSYYIETLTNELARHGWNFFKEIEKQGGFLKTLEGGYLQDMINQTREKREEAIASGETVFIGINNYPEPEERLSDKKENVFTASSLAQSDHQPDIKDSQLITSLAKAFEEGCLVGDVIDRWFSPSRQKLRTIYPSRGPQPFEHLRLQTERYEEQKGQPPRILLIPMGNPGRRKQRANFVSNLLGCAGYEIIEPLGFETTEKAMETIQDENPDMIVCCAPDELYPSMVEELMPRLKKFDGSILSAIAGYPSEHVNALSQQGIDHFIHLGSNRLELLQTLHRQFGVTGTHETSTA